MIAVFSEPMGVRVFFCTLRDVLQCTMVTHQILLRGAAQCYLLQTAMNLVDVVSWSFSLTLASVRVFLSEREFIKELTQQACDAAIRKPCW